jgi:Ca2+-binding EF-hand superfamily protein
MKSGANGGADKLGAAELSEKLMSLFRQADADGSGKLDHTEFKKVFALVKEELNLTSKDVRYIMSEADENGDGCIDYKEFVPVAVDVVQTLFAKSDFQARKNALNSLAADEARDLLLHGMPRTELVALLEDLFKRADTDGSGYLSRSEFNQCLKEADLGLTRKEINAIMSEIDSDHDGRISYEEFIPLCLEILVQITSEDIQADLVPKEEREFAQFFTDLFQNADTDESGVLHITAIKNLITSADLGLSRVQLMAILSEAVEDELGNVNYAQFGNTVAGMLFAMFRQRDIVANVEAVRKSEDYVSIHGMNEGQLTQKLTAEFAAIDPDRVGRVDRNAARAHLIETFPFTSKEIQALLSLALPDDTGFIVYKDICSHGFRCLQYLREQELLQSS